MAGARTPPQPTPYFFLGFPGLLTFFGFPGLLTFFGFPGLLTFFGFPGLLTKGAERFSDHRLFFCPSFFDAPPARG